jgi:hypothetical protein
VVVVDNLDERLNLGTLGGLLLTHGLGDLEGRTFDTSNDGITIGSILGSFIMVYWRKENIFNKQCASNVINLHTTDDDGLLACITALEDYNNLKG